MSKNDILEPAGADKSQEEQIMKKYLIIYVFADDLNKAECVEVSGNSPGNALTKDLESYLIGGFRTDPRTAITVNISLVNK